MHVPVWVEGSGGDTPAAVPPLGAAAAVYVWSQVEPGRRHQLPPGVLVAQERAAAFAARYGYTIVARYHDTDPTLPDTDSVLPDGDSAFAVMMGHLDEDVFGVVLVATRVWPAPGREGQDRMAAIIADHGGRLVLIDQAVPDVVHTVTA